MNFVEDRVMPSTRYDCKEVLRKIGLPMYDAIGMLRYNHGLSVEDEYGYGLTMRRWTAMRRLNLSSIEEKIVQPQVNIMSLNSLMRIIITV